MSKEKRFTPGQKVTYVGSPEKYDHGIVKGQRGDGYTYVVYNFNQKPEDYLNYTGVLTADHLLEEGWIEQPEMIKPKNVQKARDRDINRFTSKVAELIQREDLKFIKGNYDDMFSRLPDPVCYLLIRGPYGFELHAHLKENLEVKFFPSNRTPRKIHVMIDETNIERRKHDVYFYPHTKRFVEVTHDQFLELLEALKPRILSPVLKMLQA